MIIYNLANFVNYHIKSTVKALNDALYAAGLQDVIDAKQAQLDEFLASK
jgi:hypothetical protein